MMRWCFTLALSVMSVALADAQGPDVYAKAVKSVEATFEPAEAKPGQTVTYRVTITLNAGYYTYPTKQVDKQAANDVNRFTFPKPGSLIFIGNVIDPPNPKTKAVPELGIKDHRHYPGKVTFERKAVVSPEAKPGAMLFKLPELEFNYCNQYDCFPAKKLSPEAMLTILPGPPVPIDPAVMAEVQKALSER